MSELVFKNVCKRYGKGPDVIRDINLTIRQGEFCVFIGPSGCGKSTLLRMVAGLEEISSGELSIAGGLVNDVAPAQRGVAMVFQSYALYPHMTVYQNMAFGLKVMKGLPETIDRKVREAARALQLDGLLERLPRELSGGQRQRVAIGRAIVRQPGVFLFDEPLSNLDAELRVQTRLEIARLHADLGNSTMIYVTHDQVEAMTLADKIVLLNTGEAVGRDGSVAQAGAPLELYHHPVNRFVAGFIGSPKMNFIGAALLKAEAETATLRVAGVPFAARVDARGVDGRAGAGRLKIGIRPEHARLLGRPAPGVPGAAPRTGQDPGQDSGSADDAPPNTLAGTVAFVEQLGEATLVYVKLADGALFTVREPGGSASRVGERVAIACDPDQLHLFASDGRACRRTVDPINSTRD